MYRDPVIEELRDNAARIAEDCDGDIHRMAERFRQEQAQHPHRVVRHGSQYNKRQPPPGSE